MTPLDTMRVERLSFEIEGQPVPKARPRAGATGHFYTPTKTVNYEKAIAGRALLERQLFMKRTGSAWPMSAPHYFVRVEIYKRDARVMDGDNVFKSIADAFLKTLYSDDGGVGGFFHPPTIDARPRVAIDIVAFDAPLLHWHRDVRAFVDDVVRRSRVERASRLMLSSKPGSYGETQAWIELAQLVREEKP